MKLTLVKKEEVARGTTAFSFKTTEPFSFEAGQYIYITLPKLNYPDERGETRHFTISSSPTESEYIIVTTRIREESGYKKTLNEMPIGSIVEARGPQGFFVLNTRHQDPTIPHVFLAGGIGITPFRSIIKCITDNNINIPIQLIYSNSDNDFMFKNDLDQWKENNSNLKIDYFDSSISGHLDLEKLKTILGVTDLKQATFWVVGPNPFVNAMEEILAKLEVPEDNIKTEKFTGY